MSINGVIFLCCYRVLLFDIGKLLLFDIGKLLLYQIILNAYIATSIGVVYRDAAYSPLSRNIIR